MFWGKGVSCSMKTKQDTDFHKLYSIQATSPIDGGENLYLQGNRTHFCDATGLRKEEKVNLFTYFNLFSLKKWKRYTTIQSLKIELELKGTFDIIITEAAQNEENILRFDVATTGTYTCTFDLNALLGDVLGVELVAKEDGSYFVGGTYYGTFSSWQEKSIGVGICTFKREEYLKRTLSILKNFQEGREWLKVLVVDNGGTLPICERPGMRLIHNRNFGGSGGFARVMLEYVMDGSADYVLLMDDDIVLEPSAIERSRALLCGLKPDYKDSFLSGAMLSLENPNVQHENTAYWGKIRLHSVGKGLDMSQRKSCIQNEAIEIFENQYAAWWYCCIPTHRIKEIGYPLPVFVKGDDMEYGIRNHKEVMHMNGIGVWHQSFQEKISPVVNYYSDRNMLIINNYAAGCGMVTFLIAVIGRFVKRLLQGNKRGVICLYYAIKDYNTGMSGITSIPADEKMAQVAKAVTRPAAISVFPKIFKEMIKSFFHYTESHRNYIDFREQKLKDAAFWEGFLGIKGEND